MKPLFCALIAAQAFATAPANAECAQLLKALADADDQARVAHYVTNRQNQPLISKPVFVRIGKWSYYDEGADYKRSETDGTNPLIKSLRYALGRRPVHCWSAGSDVYRGSPVDKIGFDDPTSSIDRWRPIMLWIDQSSGLPVYQQVAGTATAIAWIYGDVDEPEVNSPVGVLRAPAGCQTNQHRSAARSLTAPC